MLMGTGFYWNNESALKLIMVMVSQLCEYAKNHLILYFKYMNDYLIYELNLNEDVKNFKK